MEAPCGEDHNYNTGGYSNGGQQGSNGNSYPANRNCDDGGSTYKSGEIPKADLTEVVTDAQEIVKFTLRQARVQGKITSQKQRMTQLDCRTRFR